MTDSDFRLELGECMKKIQEVEEAIDKLLTSSNVRYISMGKWEHGGIVEDSLFFEQSILENVVKAIVYQLNIELDSLLEEFDEILERKNHN